MQLIARPLNRFTSRLAYGAVAYWGLNVALVAAEARWHLLYRLTVWDIVQLKSLASIFGPHGQL